MTDEDGFHLPAEADRMILAIGFLSQLRLDRILEEIERAHIIGPLVDPTRYRDALYRRGKGNFEDIGELARLARPLVEAYRKLEIPEPAPPRDPGKPGLA